MPSPGSIVRLKHGGFGLITKVTPDGRDDRVLPLGNDFPFSLLAWEIAEVVYEPDSNTKTEPDG